MIGFKMARRASLGSNRQHPTPLSPVFAEQPNTSYQEEAKTAVGRPITVGWHGANHKFTENIKNRFYHDNSLIKSKRIPKYTTTELMDKLEASRTRRQQIHDKLIYKSSRKKRLTELIKQGKRMQAKLDSAAVTIQRYTRGYLTRLALNEHISRREHNRLSRQLIELDDQLEDCWMNLNDRANKAARTIQKAFKEFAVSRVTRALRADIRMKAVMRKSKAANIIQRGTRRFLSKLYARREQERAEFAAKVEALRQRHLLARAKRLWEKRKLQWRTIRKKYAIESKPEALPVADRPTSKDVLKRVGGGFTRKSSGEAQSEGRKSKVETPVSVAEGHAAPEVLDIPVSEGSRPGGVVNERPRPGSARVLRTPRETPPSYMSPTLSTLQKVEEDTKPVKKKPPKLLRRKSLTRNTISRELKVRTTKRKLSAAEDRHRGTGSNSPINSVTERLPPRPKNKIPRIPSRFEPRAPSPEYALNAEPGHEENKGEPVESVSNYKPVEVVTSDMKTALADKFSMPLEYWLSFAKKKEPPA
jgi:hypothetical protein